MGTFERALAGASHRIGCQISEPPAFWLWIHVGAAPVSVRSSLFPLQQVEPVLSHTLHHRV